MRTTEATTLGAILARCAEEEGGQGRLAAIVGVSRCTVNRWIRGRLAPSVATIPRLVAYLGVSATEVIAWTTGGDDSGQGNSQPAGAMA